MKYLGLMLDSRLSYKQQTALMTKRGIWCRGSYLQICEHTRGMPTRQFLMLYRTHVCAASDYGGHVWINPYQHGPAIRTLELLQNRMLRKALGAETNREVTHESRGHHHHHHTCRWHWTKQEVINDYSV